MDLLMMTALQKLERTARSHGRRRSMATARRGGLDLLHEGDDGRAGQRGGEE